MEQQEDIRFEQMLEDFIANRLTPAQVEVFLQQLRTRPDAQARFQQFLEDHADQPLLHSNTLPAVNWDGMTAEIVAATTPRSWLTSNAMRLAAACLIVSGSFMYYFLSTRHHTAPTLLVQAIKKTDTWRLLPDGSTVIVAAGSSLSWSSDFTQTSREVTLSGKAFFSIVPKAGMPFVVRTGKIKTTVLGTSFTIEAYPQQECKVLVRSGKVQVQQEGRVLGLLTESQALRVNPATAAATAYPISLDSSTLWLKQHLQFTETPLQTIATTMQERFGVTIHFDTPALAHCPVTATFNGTESLEETLQLLTLATKATYTIDGKTVTLGGPGCAPLHL